MNGQRIELINTQPLDKNVPIPLYYQLKQFILGQIKSGDWPAGSQIPAEQQFCDKFDISRPTVRQAITEMISEGHLTRVNRLVSVAKPKMAGDFFSKLQSFNVEMQAKNLRPSTKVLGIDIQRHQEAEEMFGADSGVICLERLRFVDDEPIVWVETYLPYPSMESLLNVDFELVSLYETIEDRYPIKIARVDRIFEASAAGVREAGILGIKKGSPICYVKTTAYNQNDEPIEFSIARYRGDKSKFMVSITRKDD